MALTGIAGQPYVGAEGATGGPAFLVYYSPAFVRAEARDDMLVALRMLAEVYRAARRLWPRRAAPEHAGRTVTLHIGEMKSVRTSAIREAYGQGDAWLLKRVSEQEAVVSRQPLDEPPIGTLGTDWVHLRFWPARFAAGAADESDRSEAAGLMVMPTKQQTV